MILLYGVLEVVRDLAVLAAAVGVVLWVWDWYSTRSQRENAVAAQLRADEQKAHAQKEQAGRLDVQFAAMARELSAIAGHQRTGEQRSVVKLRIHEMLQLTRDPFLTFAEIERGLEGAIQDTRATAGEAQKTVVVARDDLRRALMELVSDGVIAQLDRDRYFIASDYETGDASHEEEAGV